MAAINGVSNGFPEGQCTVYADERYHTLTGFYVPWSGNAQDWANNAIAYGWTVSSTPVVPSIVCLQGGVQGADRDFGHVAVAESVSGNTVVTSDLNWGPNYSQVSTVNFHPGPGVSFIYATGSNGKPLGNNSKTFSDTVTSLLTGNGGNAKISIAPTSDVTDLLYSWDQLLLLTNPFSNVHATQDNILGTSFTDPISWVEGFGMNIVDDFVALSLRLIFIIIGVVIILKVVSNFVDFGAIADTAEKGIGLAAML